MHGLSRVFWARVGVLFGDAMAAGGVGYLFGFGWALIVGGVTVMAYFLFLFDVEKPSSPSEITR